MTHYWLATFPLWRVNRGRTGRIGRAAMAQFNYKARKRSGEVVTGILEVADRAAALMQIERLGLFPIAVDMPKGAAAAAAAAAVQQPGAKSASWMEFLPPALRQHLQKQRKPKLQDMR